MNTAVQSSINSQLMSELAKGMQNAGITGGHETTFGRLGGYTGQGFNFQALANYTKTAFNATASTPLNISAKIKPLGGVPDFLGKLLEMKYEAVGGGGPSIEANKAMDSGGVHGGVSPLQLNSAPSGPSMSRGGDFQIS